MRISNAKKRLYFQGKRIETKGYTSEKSVNIDSPPWVPKIAHGVLPYIGNKRQLVRVIL